MPLLKIKGIPIDFPFTPYDSQLIYMEKVIESLENRQNALLESPTGTGKTLCLLCATLGWKKTQQLRHQKKRHQNPLLSKEEDEQKQELKIIYASRTHSQLKQVVKELKNTKYAPKVSVLGSREQLCVHEDNSKLRGVPQNQNCRALTKRNKYMLCTI